MDNNKLENGAFDKDLKHSSPPDWTQFVLTGVGEDLLALLQKRVAVCLSSYRMAKTMEEVAKIQGEERMLVFTIQLIHGLAELGRRQVARISQEKEEVGTDA